MPGEDADIFSAVESSKLNDACWLIGEKGLTVVESRYVPGVGDSVAAYKTDATPLHWAVKGDNADARKRMVALLLHYGADPSAQNEAGSAPLDLAASGDDAELLRDAGGVCYVEADDRCGLRLLPGPSAAFSATVAHGFSGGVWSVTVKAATDADAEEEVFSRLDILDPEDARLSADVEADEADEGKHVLLVSSESPLMAGEPLSASVAVWSGLQTLWASLAVTALYPVAAEEKKIDADDSGLIHQFALLGYENALFSAAEGSAPEFNVSSNGEVLRNVILNGETVYKVVADVEDEGFLGAMSLTLNVSVRRKTTLHAEFSAVRYRAAMAGGYEGAVLTLSAADEGVSLSYLESELESDKDGLRGSSFSLVSLSSGDYAVSLETAVSGPDIEILEPIFEFQRTGFPLVTATANIQVTILGPYSHTEVIQKSATSVAYRFVVPGFSGVEFEVDGSEVGSGGFYSVASTGTIKLSSPLTASVAHTVTVRGMHDGFLGDALFTLAVSVSFCDADVEREPEGDVAALNSALVQAAHHGNVGAVCGLLQQGADVEARDEDDYTPLLAAARGGHLDVVKYLLSRGDVDVNVGWKNDIYGWTPLHYAATYDRLDMVKYLLSRDDVDVDVRANYRDSSPLHWSARDGRLEVVKYLLSHYDIDAVARNEQGKYSDSYGETALHYVARRTGGSMWGLWDQLYVLKYFLSLKMPINNRTNGGLTPLDQAIENYGNWPLMVWALRAHGGVCLVSTDVQCGLIMRPSRSRVLVADNHVGAVRIVTATAHDRDSPVYNLVYSTANSDDFSLDSATGDLTFNPGVLTAGLLFTVSIQAVSQKRFTPYGYQIGTQSVTVERVVSVYAAKPKPLAGVLSNYPSLLTASSEYMGVLATLSATEEDVAVSYASGLDEKVFTLTALPSGKAALSLVARLGAEDVTATAVVELSKYGHAPTLVTARVTVSALLPTETRVTVYSFYSSTVSLSLSARHGGMRYEKISGPAELSVSDSGEISATSPFLSNYNWHHLEVRADSPGILGGERFSVSWLAAYCGSGDLPGRLEVLNTNAAHLINAINKKIGIDGICWMVVKRYDINMRNSANATPLHRAVIRDYPAAVTLLVNAGANIDAQNSRGKTPLYLAIQNQKENMARFLIKAGADVNLPNTDGYSPLDIAYEARDGAQIPLSVAADLRRAGALCLKDDSNAWCGLAVRPRYSYLTVNLNHSGAVYTVTATDPLRPNAAKIYSLIHSDGLSLTVNSKTGVLSLLPGSGALTYGPSRSAVSIRASTDGGTQSVTVEVVIYVSSPCNTRAAPITYPAANLIEAIDQGFSIDKICRMIIIEDADVNVKNAKNGTPLHRAAVHGYEDVARMLIAAGADVDARNSKGKTPLYVAFEKSKWGMASLLAAAGADVNLPDIVDGYSPLDLVFNAIENEEDYSLPLSVAVNIRDYYGAVCLIRTGSECGLLMRPPHFTVTIGADYPDDAPVSVHTVTAAYSGYSNLSAHATSETIPTATIYSLVHGEGFSVDSKTGVLSADAGILTAGFVATVSIKVIAEGGTQSVTVEVVIEVSAADDGNAGIFHPPDVFQNPPLQLIPSAGNQLKPPKLVRVRPPKIPELPAKIVLGAPPLPFPPTPIPLSPSRFRVSFFHA